MNKLDLQTAAAWLVMLLVSLLPDVFFIEVLDLSVRLLWWKVGFLILLIMLSFLLEMFRSLRNFFLLIAAIYLVEYAVGVLTGAQFWRNIFGGPESGFSRELLGIQLGRLLVSMALISAMFLIGWRRKDFFLVPGKLNAPIQPVRWLGFPKADPWTQFGGQWAAYITLGTLAFLILAGRPTLNQVWQTLPFLPIVLLGAVLNAFNEEVTYRSTLLASLEPVIGPRPALWISAVFFGTAHFYGVPYGVIGVLMATFLGWIMGKAMLETRGFFWAWLIHFLQDVVIFYFLAMGSIVPGG